MSGEGFRPNTEAIDNTSSELRKKDARIGMAVLGVGNLDENKASLEKKANLFLRRYGEKLGLFSRSSDLAFVPCRDKTFGFNARKLEVNVPLSWYANEKYTENELAFANYHEIAHFLDMRKNPDAYLKNFDYMQQKAENLAGAYLDKHPGKASLDRMTKIYYDEIHLLYNTLDDIYVNNLVFQKNKFFGSGDGREDVVSLYEKLGFGEADLTRLPPHKQMVYALLRDEMIGDTHGKSVVDERVEKVLSEKIFGMPNMRAFIGAYLKPHQDMGVDPEKRYGIIQRLIEGEFLELLEISLDEEDTQNNEDAQSVNDEFDPFGDNSMGPKTTDILDHGENGDQIIKDILEELKEEDRINKLPKKEQKKERAKKVQQYWDKDHDIPTAVRKENDRIVSEIDSARREMQDFWERLIGKSIHYRQVIVKNQERGRLHIPTTIRHWGQIQESMRNGSLDKPKIYNRLGLQRELVDQPEKIDVTLLVDCSGSMSDSKIEAAKKTAALLMYSILDFNESLSSTDVRNKTNTRLRANTQVIVFGSKSDEIKPFDDDSSGLRKIEGNQNESSLSRANEAAIIKSISAIGSKDINEKIGYSTNDAMPLGDILARLTSDEKAKIKQGKLKKIVFEITDGVPDYSALTSERLTELAKAGVIVVGFQIGNVSEDERSTFEGIWNGGQEDSNKQGVFIGGDIDKLPNSLMNALSDSLNNIVI